MTQRITNKRLRTGLVAAALAGGSMLGLSQIGTVNAQVDDTDDEPAGEPADQPTDGEERPERRVGPRLEPLAEILGMDADALREALRSGSTLAEVAADQGVAVDTVVGAIVESKTERIESAVEEGRLTREQADERLADLEESVTTRVEEGRPERGDDGFRGRGGPGGPGAPGDAPITADG